MKRKNRGFTIIELMVIVGVIGALVLLLLPALGKTRERAHRVRCVNNMKQLSMAALLYAADHNGEIPDVAPDASTSCGDLANSDYIDNEDTFICPRDTRSEDEFGPFKTSYTACLFTPASLFSRGTSSRTILYVESDKAGVAGRGAIDLSDCSSRHGGITMVSFVDGSVTDYNDNKLTAFAATVTPTRGGGGPTTTASTETEESAPTVTPLSSGGGGGQEDAGGTETGGDYPQEPATTASTEKDELIPDEPKPPKKIVSATSYQEGDKEIVEYTYDDGTVEKYEYKVDTADSGGGGSAPIASGWEDPVETPDDVW